MRRLFALAAILWFGTAAQAHRLDEYLQATLFSIGKERIQAQIRLAPGVTVFPAVMAAIDADADGHLSDAEQRIYAQRVLRDLSLSLDGQRLQPRLAAIQFPPVDDMKEGLGEILLDLQADVPPGGPDRRLVFENHHRSAISVYLVNSLVPADAGIRLAAQQRNPDQSRYELDYQQAPPPASAWSVKRWPGERVWSGVAALLLLARLAWYWHARASGNA